MTQVRAALSEDRRVGTPEEEIESLWEEVDRLAKERSGDSAGTGDAATNGAIAPAPDEESSPGEAPDASDESDFGGGLVPPAEADDAPSRRRGRGGRDPPPESL